MPTSFSRLILPLNNATLLISDVFINWFFILLFFLSNVFTIQYCYGLQCISYKVILRKTTIFIRWHHCSYHSINWNPGLIQLAWNIIRYSIPLSYPVIGTQESHFGASDQFHGGNHCDNCNQCCYHCCNHCCNQYYFGCNQFDSLLS